MLSSLHFLKSASRPSSCAPSTLLDLGSNGTSFPVNDFVDLEAGQSSGNASVPVSPQSLPSSDTNIPTVTGPESARLGSSTWHLREFENEKQLISHQGSSSPVPSLPPARVENVPSRRRILSLWNLLPPTYHIFAALIIIGNLASFAYLLVKKSFNPDVLLDAVSANLFAAVLIRNEYLLNVMYFLISKTPRNTPMIIRKHLASFHHYGGIHVGCAISALAWYIVFLYKTTSKFVPVNIERAKPAALMWANIIVCYIFALLILSICIMALPAVRRRHHNTFEISHRFGGWAAILTMWAQTVITTLLSSTALWKQPSFYLLSSITLLLISPWLRLRRIPVSVQNISQNEALLTFSYPDMPHMATIRLSLSPFREWHAFATIPSTNKYSAGAIVARAGDWTQNLIHSPPSTLWVRKPTTPNFLCFVPIFKSVLLVATGGGIGPILSALHSPQIKQMARVKVMWCVQDPHARHWEFVMETIRAVDSTPFIFNSRPRRPDLVLETRYGARVEGVEAVFIVSNKTVTDKVVNAVRGDGIPAYGAVFDS